VGSSSSKPRKGHEHPQHLPKVGSPANQKWEHETHKQQLFGTGAKAAIVIGVLLLGVVGWLILTL
jgi:hypothetical protein